jgi:predicted acyl esterase
MKKCRVGFLFLLWMAAGSAFGWTSNDVQLVLDELPAGAVHQHVMMPMRDGTRLSTHYFLPADYATESYPVVMLRSAYTTWSKKATDAKTVVDQSNPSDFIYKNTNGYVVVVQDLRGDGDSEADEFFEPRLSYNEIDDTYDTVEALATNSWCNGRVGMFGGSGVGMAPYMGWFSKAPHLTVVAPDNTAPNLYEHWSFENGVRRWIYNWLSHRGADNSEWPKPTLGDYSSHAEWEAVLAEGVVSNSTILIHDKDVWHNFFLDSTFEVFSSMTDDNHGYLVMGSGTHQGDIDELDFPLPPGVTTKYYLPSFLEILDGATITNRMYLQYFVMGDARRENAEGNIWRETESWPPPAIPTAWYMHSDGTLSTTAPTSTTDTLSYSYHPTNPVPTVGGNYSYGYTDESGAFNQLVPELTNRTDILRFETEPFTEATEITGNLEAQLYVSTDVEDTTFMVKLIDVYPAEGTNEEYYAIMRESAIMGRYWGGLTNPAPMVSGTVYRLDIDMSSISLMVETNHRIAVHITSSSDKAFEVHPNTYTQVMSYASSPTAHNTLYLNSDYPSRIVLPYYTTNAPTANVSTGALTVAEGGTAGFDVWMSGPALNNVTLTVARASGDSSLSVSSGASLVFTTNNWATPQTVTLAAAEDADADDGTAEIEITGPGVVPAAVTATESDDEVGINASVSTLNVPEGSTATFDLTLNRAPGASVTVAVSRISGDTDLSVSGSSQLVFTTGNWSDAQSVTLAAAEDADDEAGSAVFRCSADGAVSRNITAAETDNDRVPVHSGSLMIWNFQNIDPAAAVISTNASFVSTGLVFNTVSGVLTSSPSSTVVAMRNAIAMKDCDDATIADALTTGHYYSWSIEPDAAHSLSITGLVIQTDHLAPMTGLVFSSVSGFTAGDELASMASGDQVTSLDLSADSRFQDLTNSVEFRLYGYAADSVNDRLQIGFGYSSNPDDDLVLSGIVYSTGDSGNDDDADGLPNDWEATYFGGPTNATPSATASNGINTVMQCYIAGISPIDPDAAFLISDLSPLTSESILEWNASSGRVYSVYWTSNLLSSFQALETNVTGGAFTDTVHGAEEKGFYKVDVQLLP